VFNLTAQHFACWNEQKTCYQKIESLILLPFCCSHIRGEDWCMHRYRIVTTWSAILNQVGTSCKRPFRVTLSPKCSYRAPISQQKRPWDSPRKNPGENTGERDYLCYKVLHSMSISIGIYLNKGCDKCWGKCPTSVLDFYNIDKYRIYLFISWPFKTLKSVQKSPSTYTWVKTWHPSTS